MWLYIWVSLPNQRCLSTSDKSTLQWPLRGRIESGHLSTAVAAAGLYATYNLHPLVDQQPETYRCCCCCRCCRCCQSQSVDSLRAKNNLRHPLVSFCQKISSKAIMATYLFCMSLASGRTKSRHGLVRHDGNAMPGATAVPSFHHLVSVSWYAYLHIWSPSHVQLYHPPPVHIRILEICSLLCLFF